MVAALGERAVGVVDERHAAGHARGEVVSGGTDHHHDAPGHVFATVVAHALDHGLRARVPHGEALARAAAEEGPARRGAIERHVAEDHVVLRLVGRLLGRADREHPAGEALADVVVGLAAQVDRDAAGEPGAQALAGRAPQAELDRLVGQARRAVGGHDLVRDDAADRAVQVHDVALDHDRLARPDRLASLVGQAQGVERLALRHGRRVVAGQLARLGGVGQEGGEVDAMRLPVGQRLARLDQVDPADELLEAPHPHLREELADLLGDHEEVVHDVLGLAVEAAAKLRVLARDPHRARVQVADAHHDAARRDQRGGREAELVGAQERGDQHVAAGAHLTVDLQDDPRAQVVLQQGLLGLGQADLPRHPGRLDRRQRRGAGAAVVARDHHVIGAGLDHAGGHGAHADLRRQLHRDRGLRVGGAQVVDQLLQVLDRVDVVVGRW